MAQRSKDIQAQAYVLALPTRLDRSGEEAYLQVDTHRLTIVKRWIDRSTRRNGCEPSRWRRTSTDRI